MKKTIGLIFLPLLLALLVGAGAFYYTLLPQKLDVGVKMASFPVPTNVEKLPEVSLSVLKTGKMLSLEAFAWRGGRIGENYDFGMAAFLVQHPKGKILIDAGLGRNAREHLKTAPWLMRKLAKIEQEASAADQLLAAGIMPEQLAAVFITHSHWDHVSGLEDLPGVAVRMPQAELDFIKNGKAPGLVNDMIGKLNVKTFEYAAAPYENFDRSFDVFGDGSVVAVPLPGHTDGSTGIFVNLASGKRYFFVGDLIWALEGVTLPAERPWLARKLVDHDEEAVREAVIKTHLLSQHYPNLNIIPAHDLRAHDKMKTFPDVER
jgi:glyoxylase-like metal-dependent hydrolase (beta-lactamase superfamily II)